MTVGGAEVGTSRHFSLAETWAARRDNGDGLHVDTAACGRTSRAVRARILAHMSAEAAVGGYVAEDAAADELAEARRLLGGLLGFGEQDLAFVESSSAALAQLLVSWPLEAGDIVWVAPSEWGPNLAALADRGLRVGWLDGDGEGRIDISSLTARLARRRPAMVHVTALAAHRALAQPMAGIAAACSRFDVPLVVDVAQALGQVPIAGEGHPAAVYGTGRKYICGPRGVGYLAVRDPWQQRLVPRAPALTSVNWPGEDGAARRLESREASIAGRVGLGVALREYRDLGAERIQRALHDAGRALRGALADRAGWRLRDEIAAPGAIVSLVPPDDIDVRQARDALLTRGIVTTAAYPERAPREMTGPLLRFSPHVDLTLGGITRVARTLAEVTAQLSRLPPPPHGADGRLGARTRSRRAGRRRMLRPA